MKNKKKIFSLIGLATRARKTVSGECSFYEVPCYVCGTKEELAHAMGKEVRASLAVTDEGFADAIINLLN